MRRLPKIPPDALNPSQKALYEAITGGPRADGPRLFALTDEAGALEGPFNAMLLSPALGEPVQALGAAIRYRSALSVEAREVAILVVAQVWDSGFERYAHEAVARSAGLDEATVTAIREGAVPRAHQLVATTAKALAGSGDLDDEQYQAARDGLGERGLFELMTLVGYYATLALQLRVFRIDPP